MYIQCSSDTQFLKFATKTGTFAEKTKHMQISHLLANIQYSITVLLSTALSSIAPIINNNYPICIFENAVTQLFINAVSYTTGALQIFAKQMTKLPLNACEHAAMHKTVCQHSYILLLTVSWLYIHIQKSGI